MKCLAKACGDREALCPASTMTARDVLSFGKTGLFKTLPPEITLNWDEDYVTIPTSEDQGDAGHPTTRAAHGKAFPARKLQHEEHQQCRQAQ